jgi:hypothetical protein
MARVFVSHSGKDVRFAAEVHRWLVDDGHEAFLDRDLRDGLAVGEEWQPRLHERLRWADAVVSIVTSAYLESPWCTAEVAIAQSRGSRLLPIRAESGVNHPLLKSVQYVDMLAHPSAIRAALTEALRRVDAAGGAGWPDDRSPFPGLRPFDTSEHQAFFGRTADVKQIATVMRSPAELAAAALLLIVGPSGCGKSSLVRAGLLPVMAAEPGWQTLPAILPGSQPVAALTREIAAAARQLRLPWPVAEVRRRLEEGRLAELADELLIAGPGPRRRHLLVVVDQFEELLTQAIPSERANFAESLRPALANPVRLVATLRPEFLDQLLVDPSLAGFPMHLQTLRPLRREALRMVIEGPAQLAGLGMDEDLSARIAADTRSGDALPLLAYTLAQLAEGAHRGDRLLATRYEQLGGVQGALARQADAALVEAKAARVCDSEDIIKSLLRLVTVDEQGVPTRWRVPRDELPASVAADFDIFIARRLLTTDIENGSVVVGVAHEAILSAWPPLAEAISATASWLRARRHIEQAAADWDREDRHPSGLLRGPRLAAILAHRSTIADSISLSELATDYLEISEHQEAAEKRQRRTRKRLLQQLALAGFLVATVCAAAFIAARTLLLQQVDENLLQRASAAAQSELADPTQLATIPPEVLASADVRLALLTAAGAAISAEGPASEPPLGASEYDVARGHQQQSMRTALDEGVHYRVVAVQAGPGNALVIAQPLESTANTLMVVGSFLIAPGVIGLLLFIAACIALYSTRRSGDFTRNSPAWVAAS